MILILDITLSYCGPTETKLPRNIKQSRFLGLFLNEKSLSYSQRYMVALITYTIIIWLQDEVFPFQNYLKNLDLWDCFWKRKSHFTVEIHFIHVAELHKTDLHICSNFERINYCLITWVNAVALLFFFLLLFFMNPKHFVTNRWYSIKINWEILLFFFQETLSLFHLRK